MFLYVYLLSSVTLVFLIGLFLETKYKPFLTVSMLITLLTPTPALINSYMYEPALFTFFFDLLLENKYSFRVLRPLIISFPIFLTFYFLSSFFKKRFF